MRKALENRGKSKTRGRVKATAKSRRMNEAANQSLMSFADREVPLVYQQNRRARRIILRLDYGASRIVVVLPKRTSRDEGKKFVLSNKEWIAERLDQLPETVPFEHGAVIPFMGL